MTAVTWVTMWVNVWATVGYHLYVNVCKLVFDVAATSYETKMTNAHSFIDIYTTIYRCRTFVSATFRYVVPRLKCQHVNWSDTANLSEKSH